ncbi:MAG: FHA domain-containing protein [Anaerolineaceae bacterium]|nr:FHA domain-containing protein [Anaerolineaceae bacterium]
MKVFHLVIYSGAAVPRVFVLHKERVLIGRDPGCDLILDSMNISRRHALLRYSESAVTIEDMDSTNGIQVNGEILSSVRTLQPRDEILLGKGIRLVFLVIDSVRSGRNDKTDSGLRPAYPLPLPQTMMLDRKEFKEYIAQHDLPEKESSSRKGTISPPTIPQTSVVRDDKIDEDEQ